MCHRAKFIKIGQTVLEISRLCDFQYGHCAPSWILNFLHFWSTVRLGDLICIAIPKFTRISQTAETSHLTFFSKWRPSAILDF